MVQNQDYTHVWLHVSSVLVPLLRLFKTYSASANVSPNGELFAVSNPPTRFDIYRIDSLPDPHTPVRVFVDEFDAEILDSPTPVTFVHGGHALLTGSATGTPKLWDAQKGVLHHRIRVEGMGIPSESQILPNKTAKLHPQ